MEDVTHAERRHKFVRSLYALHRLLESKDRRRSAEARRQLAQLRRGLHGGRHQAEAYDLIFPMDPPKGEEDVWLLVGGLFGLHPQANDARGRSIGGAMGILTERSASTRPRFTQLLSVEGDALTHYLRQAVQLLRANDVTFDYGLLLSDLVTMGSSPEKAHKVRLRWARDFHRPASGKNQNANPSPDPDQEAS